MTKAEQRAETAALVRKARYGKRKLAIAKLPEWYRDERLSRALTRKSGGHMPACLDPVKLSWGREA